MFADETNPQERLTHRGATAALVNAAAGSAASLA